MDSKNCIFISVDKNFLKHLKICLYSISKNYKNHPDIILCHTDLTQDNIKQLRRIIKNIIPILNILEKDEVGPIMSHLPQNIDPSVFYARFLIWKLPIFRKYNSVLHLDADTIVLKACDKIFNEKDFYIEQETYIGDNSLFINQNNNVVLLEKIKEDKLKLQKKTGNAGVFMVPKRYINKYIYNEFMSILKKYKYDIKWADQSVINIWLQKNSINISNNISYNFQHRIIMKGDYSLFSSKCNIAHFNGVPDPYRIYFMKLLLILSGSFIGMFIYKNLYLFMIIIVNYLHKFKGKPVYKIY